MGTQGLVSVVIGRRVVVKAVCGCNGYNASALAEKIRDTPCFNAESVKKLCEEVGFGCRDCLVVLDEKTELGELVGLPVEFVSKFYDPRFNPRWDSGKCQNSFVVSFTWPEGLFIKIDGPELDE